jgi:hypothetical protein
MDWAVRCFWQSQPSSDADSVPRNATDQAGLARLIALRQIV